MGTNFSTLAPNIVGAILFAVLGVSTFVAAFWIVDRLTPYDLWKEVIEEQKARRQAAVERRDHILEALKRLS